MASVLVSPVEVTELLLKGPCWLLEADEPDPLDGEDVDAVTELSTVTVETRTSVPDMTEVAETAGVIELPETAGSP